VATESTEEEQIEAIKTWFDQNGVSLIVGIVVALVAVFGYQGWKKSKTAEAEVASALYSDLTEAIVAGPLDTLSSEQISTGKFIAEELKTDHPGSTYAHFAALHLAKLAVEAGDLETAEKELEWIKENNPERSVELIVNLRLAKVKTALKQYDAALALLKLDKIGAHVSSYQEQRGDIYLAMGKTEEARKAYRLALDSVVEGQTKPILQMKLEDLVDPQSAMAINASKSPSSSQGLEKSKDDAKPGKAADNVIDKASDKASEQKMTESGVHMQDGAG